MKSKALHIRFGRPATLLPGLAALVLLLFAGSSALAAETTGTDPRSGTGWFVDMNRFSRSAHAAFKCEECHGTMSEQGRTHPDPKAPDFLKTPATRRFDYRRCEKCHQTAHQRYLAGGHAEALAKEKEADAKSPAAGKPKKQAPTCGDCHSSHYERSGRSRVEVGRHMVDVCGRCHAEHTASYLADTHGRSAVDLGNPKAAFCTDCHGAHTVASVKKQQDAVAVCQRCHPKATEAFAGYIIHADLPSAVEAESPKSPQLLWVHRVRLVAIGVVALSLIFFFGHSFLWLLRECHEKLRKP